MLPDTLWKEGQYLESFKNSKNVKTKESSITMNKWQVNQKAVSQKKNRAIKCKNASVITEIQTKTTFIFHIIPGTLWECLQNIVMNTNNIIMISKKNKECNHEYKEK